MRSILASGRWALCFSGLLAAAFAPAACFKAPDLKRVTCTRDDNCPTGYYCAVPNVQGGCHVGQGRKDADVADVPGREVSMADVNVQTDSPLTLDAVTEARQVNPDQAATTVEDQRSDRSTEARDRDLTPATDQATSDQGTVAPDQATAASDLGRDGPTGPDLAPSVEGGVPDLPLPEPDTGNSCSDGCCKDLDCPGPCQVCSTSHACVSVLGKDDPTGRCAGTCDSTGACKSKPGQTCQSAASCLQGTFCSPDGRCCDRACSGPCESCETGVCAPVSGSPHKGHASCDGADPACAGSCTGAVDGQCNWPGTSCGQASCATQTNSQGQPIGTTYVAQGGCKNGSCSETIPTSCSGGLICASSAACKTSCGADSDCLTGNTCSGEECVGKKSAGAACSTANECTSNACVDEFCCENSCTGTCMACSLAKTGATNGLCRPVSAGEDPDSDCSVDTGDACSRDGTCDGLGACRLRPTGTTCGNPSCADGTLTPGGKCNGSGACIPSTTSAPCPGNLLCASNTACATTCTDRSTTGCPAGRKCVNGSSCALATVDCGGMSCPVADGSAGCCATDPDSTGTNAVLTCQGPTDTCSTGSLIPCNSGAECPSGQICCAKGNGCKPTTWDLHCQADASDCLGGVGSYGYQVCDPNLSPSECLTGTCQQFSCLPGVYVCSHS
jgi:hypothetical protein